MKRVYLTKRDNTVCVRLAWPEGVNMWIYIFHPNGRVHQWYNILEKIKCDRLYL